MIETPTHFRKYRDGRLIAVFPTISHGRHDDQVGAYTLDEGPIAVNWADVMDATRDATPAEYDDMAEALRGLGILPLPRQRVRVMVG